MEVPLHEVAVHNTIVECFALFLRQRRSQMFNLWSQGPIFDSPLPAERHPLRKTWRTSNTQVPSRSLCYGVVPHAHGVHIEMCGMRHTTLAASRSRSTYPHNRVLGKESQERGGWCQDQASTLLGTRYSLDIPWCTEMKSIRAYLIYSGVCLARCRWPYSGLPT